MRRIAALGMAVITCLAIPSSGHATSLKDVQVGIRTVEFLRAPPLGRTDVAIVYDRRRKASEDDARAILVWLLDNSQGSKVEIAPILVEIGELATLRRFPVAMIANGVPADQFPRILDYSRLNGTVTISSDLSCVHAGQCTLGISSSPRVEVILIRQVATSCGIDFLEAFRMMVKEEY